MNAHVYRPGTSTFIFAGSEDHDVVAFELLIELLRTPGALQNDRAL